MKVSWEILQFMTFSLAMSLITSQDAFFFFLPPPLLAEEDVLRKQLAAKWDNPYSISHEFIQSDSALPTTWTVLIQSLPRTAVFIITV